MSEIIEQLWDTAQKGFTQSYSQPAQGANLEPIDSRLKFKKMGPPSSSGSGEAVQTGANSSQMDSNGGGASLDGMGF